LYILTSELMFLYVMMFLLYIESPLVMLNNERRFSLVRYWMCNSVNRALLIWLFDKGCV